jgi:hypothetical protein
MNSRVLHLYWVVLCAAGASFGSGCRDLSSRSPAPADCPPATTATSVLSGSASWAFSPNRDLRLLVCTKEALTDREKRFVCYVDVYGLPLGKAEATTTSMEVPVSKGDSVRSVLDKAGWSRWRGGQPQVRLVARDVVAQSPLPEAGKGADPAKFLSLGVSAGDLIIVATIE